MADIATVLLVEDDALLRDAFRMLLEDGGYSVVEASTAAEALSRSREISPAAILLDMGLPDRSGLDVTREMRDMPDLADVPIIALTGHAGSAEERACLEAGCTGYLAKPVEPSLLLERVEQILA